MAHQKHHLLLGAHMSIAGGFDKAIERGQSIGCTTIQIFSKSNRQWHAKPIAQEEADLFKKALKESPISSVIVHASYLINIASPDTKTNKQSLQALIQELQRCEKLGVSKLVLHPGAFVSSTAQEGIKRIIENIDEALAQVKGDVMILLENMAGQGSSLCATFEQLADISSKVHHKKRVGIAFDTCHAFAAGYDFSTEKKYEDLWKKFDQIVGIEHLKAMHINDSKKECGARADRHEEIGKGKMGLESFQLLFNDPRFFGVPKILETPQDDLAHYEKNMEIIKGLLSRKTRDKLEI